MLWLGENTTLVCDAVGNPVPNITYSVLGENASVVYSKTLGIESSSVTYVKMYTSRHLMEYSHQCLSMQLLLCWVSVVLNTFVSLGSLKEIVSYV